MTALLLANNIKRWYISQVHTASIRYTEWTWQAIGLVSKFGKRVQMRVFMRTAELITSETFFDIFISFASRTVDVAFMSRWENIEGY